MFLERSVDHFLQNYPNVSTARTWYCALSGGADSVALFALLHEVAQRRDVIFEAIYVHHGLRKRADEDVTFCESLCERYGVKLHVVYCDVKAQRKSNESIETAARRCRYTAFQSVISSLQTSVLFLAHHRDDMIENFWIRAMRGANLSSLISPEPSVVWDGLHLARPFLNVRKDDIYKFLNEKKLVFIEDETNLDAKYALRNFLRQDILAPIYQKYPYARDGISVAIDQLSIDKDFIETAAQTALEACFVEDKLKRRVWYKFHPAIRFRVMRDYLRRVYPSFQMRQSLIDGLMKLDEDICDVKRISLDDSASLYISSDWIHIESIVQKCEETLWDFTQNKQIQWGEYTLITQKVDGVENLKLPPNEALFAFPREMSILVLRQYTSQDEMIPYGKNSTVSIKKLATNLKMSAMQRNGMILCCNAQKEVVWIPFLRRSAHYTVSKDSKNIWHIQCIKNK